MSKKWLGIILSIILLLFSINGLAQYTYTQQSGTGYFVSGADKSDALEDTIEVRMILDSFGSLLGHSKYDTTYPKDGDITVGYLSKLNSGLDAAKPALPAVNDMYLATDTTKVYKCFVATNWVQVYPDSTDDLSDNSIGDLSDVNTSTPTDKYVLVADGVDFESRLLVEADISDLGTYLENITAESILDLSDVAVDPNADRYLFWDDSESTCTWAEGAGGGVTTLTGLTDTPANYTDAANKFLQVNGTPDAVIFDMIGEADISDLGTLVYLKTAIDTLGELETIYGVDITTSTELSTALGDYYLKTAIDTQSEMETIWGDTLMNDLVDDTTPELGGHLDAKDKNIKGMGRASFTQEYNNGSKTASFTVDFANDQKQKVTLTANTMTLTLDTTSVGVGNYLLKIVNGGLATLTWASESGSVYWPGGTEPDLTSSGTDIVSMYFDGSSWYCQAALDFE